MSDALEGRVAIITGAARGQGAAEARMFIENGARVVLADILAEEGQALADELGNDALFVELDVASESGWAEVVDATVRRFQTVDVLVNNAGIATFAPLIDLRLDDFRRMIDVNEIGVMLGMRSVAPIMRSQARGSIINVSSVDGIRGSLFQCAYVATKFAVTGMTKVAALELGPHGIRVNSLHPGPVRTPMIINDEVATVYDVEASAAKMTALERLAEPSELAAAALFLASDASSYCTGAELVVDGGMTCGLMTLARF